MYSRIRAAAIDMRYSGYYPIKREQVTNRVRQPYHPSQLSCEYQGKTDPSGHAYSCH